MENNSITIAENKALRPYNTFGIDAVARYFTTFQSIEEVYQLYQTNLVKEQPQLIVGGGSNILFTKNYNGMVLKNEIRGIAVVKEDSDDIYVKAGGGENWQQLVQFCLENNYAGLENLALIPGSVGASPMQNIGAYGVEIKDVFYQLEAYDKEDKKVVAFSAADCEFGYRESVFKKRYKNRFVILSVTYRLHKQPQFNISYGAIQQELEKMGVQQLSIQAIAEAVIRIRTSKLPDWRILGNAGSFFKNPQLPTDQFLKLKEQYPAIPSFPIDASVTKVPAGWLIEQCGWKGYRKGDAGCYEKQALVLVNYGHATGREIYELSEAIIESVRQKYDIKLEREVNII